MARSRSLTPSVRRLTLGSTAQSPSVASQLCRVLSRRELPFHSLFTRVRERRILGSPLSRAYISQSTSWPDKLFSGRFSKHPGSPSLTRASSEQRRKRKQAQTPLDDALCPA